MKRITALFTGMMVLLLAMGMNSCQSTKSATASKMLKFNFEKGKGYDYEMIINVDREINDKPMQMDMINYYSMVVTGEEGGMKTITTTIDRFKMTVGVSGLNISIDTDNPLPAMKGNSGKEDPAQMLNKIFGAIKGQHFTMKVTEEGEVKEVTGFTEMANSIADSMQLGEEEKAMMMKSISERFNEREMKGQFERVLFIFPNKEVKVGDSWQKVTTPGGEFGGKYTSTYTVKDIEGDMVTLEERSKIEAVSAEMNMSGNISGLIVVDSKTGLVVNADQDMSITTKQGGKDVQIKGKSKIKGKARG